MSKLTYLGHCLRNIFKRPQCPYCGSLEHTHLDQKYLVSRLLKCEHCQLQYRIPVDTERNAFAFYNGGYRQGFTTKKVSAYELENYKKTNFADSEKAFTKYIAIISQFADPGARIFDFGCSWGYGAHQYKVFGYDVRAFDISQERSAVAQTLGVEIQPVDEAPAGAFDVFTSTHVIEHLPNPRAILNAANKLLNQNGVVFIACPNGSVEFKEESFDVWHKCWGEAHPLALSAEFLQTLFAEYYCCIFSNHCSDEDIRWWDRSSNLTLNLTGEELYCVAIRRNQPVLNLG